MFEKATGFNPLKACPFLKGCGFQTGQPGCAPYNEETRMLLRLEVTLAAPLELDFLTVNDASVAMSLHKVRAVEPQVEPQVGTHVDQPRV